MEGKGKKRYRKRREKKGGESGKRVMHGRTREGEGKGERERKKRRVEGRKESQRKQ